jgi:hypothetical protein
MQMFKVPKLIHNYSKKFKNLVSIHTKWTFIYFHKLNTLMYKYQTKYINFILVHSVITSSMYFYVIHLVIIQFT